MRIGTNETGFVKVASAMPVVTPGDPKKNAAEILALVQKASAEAIDLLVLPELCLTGYTAADLFVRDGLLASAEKALEDLLRALSELETETLVVFGLPINVDGRLFNAALFCQKGRPLAVIPKSHLPAYQEFYEPRWFSPASEAISREVTIAGTTVPFGTDIIVESPSGLRVAAEICEDLWVACPPGVRHAAAGANVVVNLSASDDTTGKANFRRDLVKMASARSSCAYVYSSSGQGESTTDLVFSGHLLIAAGGRIANEWKWEWTWQREAKLITAVVDLERIELERIRFRTFSRGIDQEALRNYRHVKADATPAAVCNCWPDTVDAMPFVPKSKEAKAERTEKILRMQARALATRLEKTGLRRVVIGVSGGLDSTLALLAIRRAFNLLDLPKENMIGITMPGFGTSGKTKANAQTLMEVLFEKSLREIDIKPACLQHFKDIGHDENDFSVTYENTQARERTQILMDVANKEGAIVVGTSDMSELALGWATFNGDHMSMYAINAGIPKTLVKTLVEAEAERLGGEAQAVLTRICNTEISPELLPSDVTGEMQSTEGTIGRYVLHDFFLFHLMRNGFARARIVKLAQIAFQKKTIEGKAVTPEEIEKTAVTFFKRFYTQQFKRSSMPDGPKIGSVALSPRGDLRMPSDLSALELD